MPDGPGCHGPVQHHGDDPVHRTQLLRGPPLPLQGSHELRNPLHHPPGTRHSVLAGPQKGHHDPAGTDRIRKKHVETQRGLGHRTELRGTLACVHGQARLQAGRTQGKSRSDHGHESEVRQGIQVHQGEVPELRRNGDGRQAGAGVRDESEAVWTAGPPGQTQQVPQGKTGRVYRCDGCEDHCESRTGKAYLVTAQLDSHWGTWDTDH